MYIIGVTFITAALVQIAIVLYSSLTRLKWEKRLRLISLRRFDQLVDLEIRRNRTKTQTEAAWQGYRNFVVRDKVEEGKGICSFRLVPQDGKMLPGFKPGQYLTFRLPIPGQARPIIRCYSLSDATHKNYYRVTIKKLLAPTGNSSAPPGLVSNYFHNNLKAGDSISVQSPRGEFFLDTEDSAPIVLIAGGIGLTPLYSMLSTLVKQKSTREIWFLYGIRNEAEHIFKQKLQEFQSRLSNLHLRVFYSAPPQSDITQPPPAMSQSSIEVDEYQSGDGDSLPVLVKIGDDERYTVAAEGAVIGRSESADIVIKSEWLSNSHSRIFRKGPYWYIEDLHSKNGTKVGDYNVTDTPCMLDHNSIIYLGSGKCRYRFLVGELVPSSGAVVQADDYIVTKNPNRFTIKGQRVDMEILKSLLPSNNYDFYICGPPGMMESLTTGLQDWGVPAAKIHFESFGPASVKKVKPPGASTPAAAESSLEISFSRSDKKLKWNPTAENLLDFAESHGIALDSGCRAGNCGTCAVPLIAGRVKYPTTPGAAVEEGCCLSCIAVPQSDLSIDA